MVHKFFFFFNNNVINIEISKANMREPGQLSLIGTLWYYRVMTAGIRTIKKAPKKNRNDTLWSGASFVAASPFGSVGKVKLSRVAKRNRWGPPSTMWAQHTALQSDTSNFGHWCFSESAAAARHRSWCCLVGSPHVDPTRVFLRLEERMYETVVWGPQSLSRLYGSYPFWVLNRQETPSRSSPAHDWTTRTAEISYLPVHSSLLVFKLWDTCSLISSGSADNISSKNDFFNKKINFMPQISINLIKLLKKLIKHNKTWTILKPINFPSNFMLSGPKLVCPNPFWHC